MNRDFALRHMRKECYFIMPLVYALLGLEFVGLLDSFFSQPPDELYWMQLSLLLNSNLNYFTEILFLIGVIAGYMIFASERSRGTLIFLWGLPIGRSRVFGIKLLTAFSVLGLYYFSSHLLSWWLQSFNTSSFARAQFT